MRRAFENENVKNQLQQFFTCAVGTEDVLYACASGDAFDQRQQRCVSAMRVDGCHMLGVAVKAPSSGFERDGGQCGRGRVVIDGHAYALQCATGTQFNETAGTCDPNVDCLAIDDGANVLPFAADDL